MVDYSKLVKIHDAPPITIDILSGEAIEQTVDTLLSIKKRLAEEIKKRLDNDNKKFKDVKNC